MRHNTAHRWNAATARPRSEPEPEVAPTVDANAPDKPAPDTRPADVSPAVDGPAMTGSEIKARVDDFTRWRTRHLQLHRQQEGTMPE